jgi:glycerate kinase
MRFLIAPDKFKGSCDAPAVAENIARGIRDVLPDAGIEIAPVADGGEGTTDILCQALDGEWVSCAAHDPLGRVISADYAWMEETRSAVMEMSEAAGLRRLKLEERDPLRATTFGVGEMIANATCRGASQIIIGLGGSATNDGGFGMARALGHRFLAGEKVLTNGVLELNQLTRIVQPSGPAGCQIIAAVDVRSPLLGEHGATRVFAAQKGAWPEQIVPLENALRRLADTVARELGCDFREKLGAGAAGGLGFGLMSFCHARVRPGFEVVAGAIGLEKKIRHADVVITGEGRLDAQTAEGKAPAAVAMMARKLGKSVYAIVGEMAGEKEIGGSFKKVFELVRPPIDRTRAMKRTGQLLRERAAELARSLGAHTGSRSWPLQ